MRRALALFLVFVLLFSHGGVSEAAPHAVGDGLAAHSHAVAHDSHDTAPEPADPDKGLGQASHMHVAFDLTRADDVGLAALPVGRNLFVPAGTSPLLSRGIAPLLEPPAA